MRILLVEDEGLIRLMTTEALQEEGFDVVEARDGDEAIRLLDGPDAFDVLLTDVRMPGEVDGIGVAKHARLRYPAIPILVVSGHAPNLMKRLDALAPAAVFISKPYSLEAIALALRHLTETP